MRAAGIETAGAGRHWDEALAPAVLENCMKYSSITAKGQITIPAYIRKNFGLEVGSKVAFQVEGNTIKLVPVLDDVTAAFGLLKSDKSVKPEDMEKAVLQNAAALYDRSG